MSSTVAGTVRSDCQTPPLKPASEVNRSRCANGSQVEPSKLGRLLPEVSSVLNRVMRCLASASRLMRVMYPGVPDSWPWNRKWVPYL